MNPYKVLQVDREADHEVIEAAYRRLASKDNPDENPAVDARARAQQINAAYEILRDPAGRRAYDKSQGRASALQVTASAAPIVGRVAWAISGALMILVALGVASWVRRWVRDSEAARELAKLNVQELLSTQMRAFSSACQQKASVDIGDMAPAYCGCISATLRRDFDLGPIRAASVEAYRATFNSRFEAAVPGAAEQAQCFEQSKPPAPPAASATPRAPQ